MKIQLPKLGQKREHASGSPKLFLLTVCFICACATICFVVSRSGSRSATPLRLWSPVIIETSGTQTTLPDTRQLEFWTPSAKTVDYLHKEDGHIAATEQWQVVSNEDAVVQFGAVLRGNVSVLGYRRVEVWGQGRTGFKPGWWWTVNVLTNYTAADLGSAYQNYWKSHRAVFVEIIDNRGRIE